MSMEITKQNGNIAFAESEHAYWDVTDSSKKFTSVTTLIHSFTQPFDKNFWSAYKALEKLLPKDRWNVEKKSLLSSEKFNPAILEANGIDENDFNREQQNILDEWDKENAKSCERGTKIHAELENSFYKKKKNIDLSKYEIGGKFECIKDYTTLDLENGVYPEYLISRISNDGELCLAGQIDLLVKKGHHYVIGDWKGLPLDTEILTTKGWSTMGDLKVGDKVYDKDGKECNVIIKSTIHNNPCYKITFTKDFSITADCDHRWLIMFSTHPNTKYHGEPRFEIMTTKQLAEYLESYNPKNQYQVPKILINKPIEGSEIKTPVNPYLLGLWLGDGDKSCSRITQPLGSKSWEILENKGYEIGPNNEHRDKKAETRNVYGLMTNLRTLGVLNNKHIPEQFYTASIQQRIDLVRGLMDSDGFYDKKHERYMMSCNQEWQANDFIKLLSTLGIKAQLNIVKRSGYTNNVTCYDVKFNCDFFNPFLCRNQDIIGKKEVYDYWRIKSVELTDTIPTQCIQVDSPSHTYLCTKHLLVTHNTNKEIRTKSYFSSKIKKSVMMKFPLNTLQDCNYNHYTLQLSTYAWMIQKLDPEAIIDDLVLVHFDHDDNMTVYHLDYLKDDVEKMLLFYKKQSTLEKRKKSRERIQY